MRTALALLLVLGGCRDLTSVGPDRLPPPDREVRNEGNLSNPRDPCGALALGPVQRLSATGGDSDDVRLTSIVEPGGERFVAAVWRESPLPDEERSSGQVQAQLLLADGSRFGDVMSLPVARPRSLDVAPVTFDEAAGVMVVVADEEGPAIVCLLSPSAGEIAWLGELPALSSPSIAVLPEAILVAGLDPAVSDAALLVELRPTGPQGATTDLGIEARAVVVATSGTESWIGWLSEEALHGAPLERTEDGWELGAQQTFGLYSPWPMRRAQGTADLTVAIGTQIEEFASIEVLRLDDRGWSPIASLGLGPQDAPLRAASAALGEAGGRWGILRAFQPLDGPAPEVRLERLRPGYPACSTPTECIRVTTDEQPSEPGDLTPVPGGWAVGWSDEVDGQTDVFFTVASCRETSAPEDDAAF